MAKSELLRLERIEVDDLFRVYNHRINLDLNDRITLLHGQNGVGKTTVLRMTDAILRGSFSRFRKIPFTRFMLGFHDGSTLELRVASEHKSDTKTHELKLTTSTDSNSEVVNLGPSGAESIAAQIDYLHPHETMADTWIDIRDGEVLLESDIFDRFGDRFPSVESRHKDLIWFSDFLEKANAHFIEAQRLVRRHREPKSSRSMRRVVFNHRPISSVVDCSEDFRNQLDDKMANYGRRAQSLDQSFPHRLITATEELTGDELQAEMDNLDRKTAGLKEIGILDDTPDHPFDIGSLGNMEDPTKARVLTLYVQDTAGKLLELDDFANRTRLFLGSMNAKFRYKKVRLDRQKGLVAVSETGDTLELDNLSSGEQHELVLHYDLLFRVPSNTVVLIDEPELSLHVAWQKRFLSDLVEIVQLSEFDALIATHSPFIIGDRIDLMVGLGDTD